MRNRIWTPERKKLSLMPGVVAGQAVGGGGGGGDPYFSSVVSLLHFDGSDGATSTTDQKGKSWTFNGSAQIDTAQKKFGGSSLYLPTGGSSYLSSASHVDWAIGSATDFTVEEWIYLETANSNGSGVYCGLWSISANLGLSLFLNDGDKQLNCTATYSAIIAESADVLTPGVWHHVAVTRQSGTIKLWFDGVEVASSASWSGGVFAQGPALIGIRGTGSGGVEAQQFHGWIDEVRVTKGVCRYTSNFTPPTAAFPDA